MHTSGSHPFSALSLAADRDRRSQPRLSAEVLGLDVDASLSQGVYVKVLNVSTGGALVELEEWIRPGTRSALKLTKPTEGDGQPPDRLVAHGQVVRCWVNRLAPLRYRAAMIFATAAPSPSTPSDTTDLMVLLERPA